MAGDTAIWFWYLIPAVIGAVIYEKNRIIGFIGGLIVAFIAITVLALTIGG